MKYEKKVSLKPEWKNILDTRKYPEWISLVINFVPIVKSVGYELFLFNDYVWEIIGDDAYNTGWTLDDLE